MSLLPGFRSIVTGDMGFNICGTHKNTITLIMSVLLTAVFCGSVGLSCEYFEPAGVLKGNANVSISHFLEAFPTSAASEEPNRDSGDPQNLGKRYVPSDMFCRIIRKILVIFDGGRIPPKFTDLKHFCLPIFISGCVFLFLLTHIRFIHLKDGCK